MSKDSRDERAEEEFFDEFDGLREKKDYRGIAGFLERLKKPVCVGDVCEDYGDLARELFNTLTITEAKLVAMYEV